MAKANEISALDVLGPNMIGPSSSHTAGALRISLLAGQMMTGPVEEARFLLYGSFARTYEGHGTDKALLAGILGFHADDPRIRDSFAIARERELIFQFDLDLEDQSLHPNTVDIELKGPQGSVSVRGESVGGGRAVIRRINGVDIEFTGAYNTIMINHVDRPGVVANLTQVLSANDINIAFMKLYREQRGRRAYMIIETDETVPSDIACQLASLPSVDKAVVIPALDSAAGHPSSGVTGAAVLSDQTARDLEGLDIETLDFTSGTDMIRAAGRTGLLISELMIRREELLFGRSREECMALMGRAWEIMKASVRDSYEAPRRSIGGLIGGESRKLKEQRDKAESSGREALTGSLMSRASSYAMGVLEVNASMGLIVAAPTAGAAGIVPGSFCALAEMHAIPDERMIQALYNAAAIGMVIMANGSVSGAEGGCQAETGSAAAMAASAITELLGGSVRDCLSAASTCLQNVLGLVCDPVGGLVEAPCQRRNALGAANALLSAEMSLAGLSNIVPFDEMVEVTRKVGANMPTALRETAEGGTARAPSACEACGLC